MSFMPPTEVVKEVIGGPSDFGAGWIIILVSSLITIAIALVGFAQWALAKLNAKNIYLRKTLQLTIGMHIRNFENILGIPAFINKLDKGLSDYEEYVFSNQYFYTQAIINSRQEVVLFSITTRGSDFSPEFQIGGSGIAIRLGKTFFSEIGGDPVKTFQHYDHGGIGFYSEVHFFGRPGHYLQYAFSININGPMNYDFLPRSFSGQEPDDSDEMEIKIFRSNTPINTYSVIGSIDVDEIVNLILGPRTGQVWNLGENRIISE